MSEEHAATDTAFLKLLDGWRRFGRVSRKREHEFIAMMNEVWEALQVERYVASAVMDEIVASRQRDMVAYEQLMRVANSHLLTLLERLGIELTDDERRLFNQTTH